MHDIDMFARRGSPSLNIFEASGADRLSMYEAIAGIS
jgi:hypothetical protein